MIRKVILDIDPGIDDAVAVTMALFDPRLEVVAVTAVAGNVPADQASRNVQALVERLDPPRWPRIGAAAEPDVGSPADTRHIFGADGLGNLNLSVAELAHRHRSEKVICDEVRAAPGEVSILALGPLTNVARAMQRDPELVELIDLIYVMGGTLAGPGNVTPAAEFNFYCDPLSARAVLRSAATITVVPLDVTSDVMLSLDLIDKFSETSRAGALLRPMLTHAFRTHRQELGLEGIHLHDAVALLAMLEPELFQTRTYPVEIETTGTATLGASIYDRRPRPEAGHRVTAVVSGDAVRAATSIVASLERACKESVA